MATKDNASLGQTIASRLKGFVESAERGDDVLEKFTCRTIKLNLEPLPYDADLVRDTRTQLCASQAIFAQFLGVSVSTVHDWEQGVYAPSGSPCRLMDEIRRDPEYWKQRLRELASPIGT